MEALTLPQETPAETDLNQAPESRYRVRFQDCDPFGHLNNGRYLDYFINAREEHLRDYYDLDIYGDSFQERNWVVRASMVTHLIPAINNQTILIQTRLLNRTGNSLLMEGVMMNADRSRIHATAWIDFRHIDLSTGRPAKHNPELMDLFTRISLESEFDFGSTKKRISDIKRSLARPAEN